MCPSELGYTSVMTPSGLLHISTLSSTISTTSPSGEHSFLHICNVAKYSFLHRVQNWLAKIGIAYDAIFCGNISPLLRIFQRVVGQPLISLAVGLEIMVQASHDCHPGM